MTERTRVRVLIFIMAIGTLAVAGTGILILYRTAFDEERSRLVETTQSQARLIEAVAHFDSVFSAHYPGGAEKATLDQIKRAHREYESFGNSGEFTLARREGDDIVFLLRHRHGQVESPRPIPFDSDLAEPMRRALMGESGTVVGLDYRGEVVLAAHEPVSELNLGIVAKIDLAEVQAPFKRAGLLTTAFTLVVVLGGALLFLRISQPMVEGLEKRSRELMVTNAALRESEDRFQKTFDHAAVGIAHVAIDGQFMLVNQPFCEISGYSHGELLELNFRDITHPDDLEADLANTRRLLDGEIEHYSLEKRYVGKDSSIVWVNLTVSLVYDRTEQPKYFIAIVEDASERKSAELAIKNSLAEKEILLREIHHRVKNNMQVISSLISLQSRGITDPQLSKIFKESQNRVRAMALIHEILYESGDLSSIGLGEYVTKLATSLFGMFHSEPGRIQLEVSAGDITLGIDDTVPCGLVINELLSNSLKYAFRDGRHGKISIDVTSPQEGNIELVVCDNGMGIPEDIDIRTTDTMGMQLVTGLVENQLGGEVALDRSDGTCFTITFTSAAPSVRI